MTAMERSVALTLYLGLWLLTSQVLCSQQRQQQASFSIQTKVSSLEKWGASFCPTIRGAKTQLQDIDDLVATLRSVQNTKDTLLGKVETYRVLARLVDAQNLLCQQMAGSEDDGKDSQETTSSSKPVANNNIKHAGKVYQKVHVQPVTQPRNKVCQGRPTATVTKVAFIAPAPGHVDRVITERTVYGHPQTHNMCVIRRDANSLQHKKLRLAKLGTTGRLGDKPVQGVVPTSPATKHVQDVRKNSAQPTNQKQTHQKQTCNVVPKSRDCMQVQRIEDNFPRSKQVKVKPEPPSPPNLIDHDVTAAPSGKTLVRRNQGPGMVKQLNREATFVKRQQGTKPPKEFNIGVIRGEGEAIVYTNKGNALQTSQFTLIKRCTAATCPQQYRRLRQDAERYQQCQNKVCNDQSRQKKPPMTNTSFKNIESSVTPKDIAVAKTRSSYPQAPDALRSKKTSQESGKPRQGVPQSTTAAQIPTDPQRKTHHPQEHPPKDASLPEVASSDPNVIPVMSVFVAAETDSTTGYQQEDDVGDEEEVVEVDDDDEDEEDEDGEEQEDVEAGEPYDEEDLGSWLRLRKWKKFLGRISREVRKTTRLCVGALMARNMERIEHCQDRIGTSFAMSFTVAFTSAALILVSTFGTVFIAARMVDSGIKPPLSRLVSFFTSPKSYAEIEEASRALPDGYVASTKRDLVAFVDKSIKTDICVLSMSTGAESQVQKIMQRIFKMDYKLREADTTFYQLDGLEGLQSIPEARMYAVLVDSTVDKVILEDPLSGKRGPKFRALDRLLNKGADVILIYMGDANSRQLPKGRLYNHVVLSHNANFIIRTLCRNNRLLTINTDFTPSQTAAVHDWILYGLAVEKL